jgi:hypothetical protein
MVAPWANVSDALSPNFTLTGDAAVAKVLPTTQRVQDQVLRALGLSLAIGLPTSSRTSSQTIADSLTNKAGTNTSSTTSSASGTPDTSSSTSTTTGATSTDGSTSNTSTNSTGPGSVPTAPSGLPAGSALPAGMANSGDLGVDPVLQYKAANYLYQSVQLLNREVQAAATRKCYEPYVVKLKLAVMPYRPNLGYDLHTRISFNDTGEAGHFGPLDAVGFAKVPANDQTVYNQMRSSDACIGEGHVPIVVPMLAADDLQMATRSKAVEEAQQIGLALNFMIHGVGGNAGFNKANQRLNAILNNELSSSLTISREADNTLYIRIGANNVASGEPSLIGQTYDIALLLLVPHGFFAGEGATTVGISTFTEFRDATNGAVLGRRTSEARIARANQLLEPFLSQVGSDVTWAQLTIGEKQWVIDRLVTPVQEGNYFNFVSALADPLAGCPGTCPNKATPLTVAFEGAAPSLWTALSALIADSPFKTTLLELPDAVDIRTSTQDVFVQDDGKDNATVLITGISGYSPGSLRPVLHIVPVDDKGRSQSLVTVPVQAAGYDASARSLTLTFPSLAKLGIKKTAPNGNTLDISPTACDETKRNCPTLDGARSAVSYVAHMVATTPASKKPAAFTMAPAAPTIVIQKDGEGLGHAAIVVTKLPKGNTAAIAVAGAEVLSAVNSAGVALSLSDDGYGITSNGTYTFALRGLRDDSNVTFTGQELKNGSKLGTTPLSVRATSH